MREAALCAILWKILNWTFVTHSFISHQRAELWHWSFLNTCRSPHCSCCFVPPSEHVAPFPGKGRTPSSDPPVSCVRVKHTHFRFTKVGPAHRDPLLILCATLNIRMQLLNVWSVRPTGVWAPSQKNPKMWTLDRIRKKVCPVTATVHTLINHRLS